MAHGEQNPVWDENQDLPDPNSPVLLIPDEAYTFQRRSPPTLPAVDRSNGGYQLQQTPMLDGLFTAADTGNLPHLNDEHLDLTESFLTLPDPNVSYDNETIHIGRGLIYDSSRYTEGPFYFEQQDAQPQLPQQYPLQHPQQHPQQQQQQQQQNQDSFQSQHPSQPVCPRDILFRAQSEHAHPIAFWHATKKHIDEHLPSRSQLQQQQQQQPVQQRVNPQQLEQDTQIAQQHLMAPSNGSTQAHSTQITGPVSSLPSTPARNHFAQSDTTSIAHTNTTPYTFDNYLKTPWAGQASAPSANGFHTRPTSTNETWNDTQSLGANPTGPGNVVENTWSHWRLEGYSFEYPLPGESQISHGGSRFSNVDPTSHVTTSITAPGSGRSGGRGLGSGHAVGLARCGSHASPQSGQLGTTGSVSPRQLRNSKRNPRLYAHHPALDSTGEASVGDAGHGAGAGAGAAEEHSSATGQRIGYATGADPPVYSQREVGYTLQPTAADYGTDAGGTTGFGDDEAYNTTGDDVAVKNMALLHRDPSTNHPRPQVVQTGNRNTQMHAYQTNFGATPSDPGRSRKRAHGTKLTRDEYGRASGSTVFTALDEPATSHLVSMPHQPPKRTKRGINAAPPASLPSPSATASNPYTNPHTNPFTGPSTATTTATATATVTVATVRQSAKAMGKRRAGGRLTSRLNEARMLMPNSASATATATASLAQQQQLPCDQCDSSAVQPTMYDALELQAHKKKFHEKYFVCRLVFASCKETFGNKNDMKRHVRTIHFQDQYWYCIVCKHKECFLRRDLIRQHLRRKHTPAHLKIEEEPKVKATKRVKDNGDAGDGVAEATTKKKPVTKKGGSSGGDANTVATIPSSSADAVSITDQRKALAEEFEIVIRISEKSRIALPDHAQCPMPSCGQEFKDKDMDMNNNKNYIEEEEVDKVKGKGKGKGKGKATEIGAWEEHMEHLAVHMQQDFASSLRGPVATGGHTVAPPVHTWFGTGTDTKTLIPWAIENGILLQPGVEGMAYGVAPAPVPSRADIEEELKHQNETLRKLLRERPGQQILQFCDDDAVATEPLVDNGHVGSGHIFISGIYNGGNDGNDGVYNDEMDGDNEDDFINYFPRAD